jgi:hypothetical protein
MGVIGWLAHVSMKQAVLMGLIASLPGLFISYTVRDPTQTPPIHVFDTPVSALR